jgi:hypothetical protein
MSTAGGPSLADIEYQLKHITDNRAPVIYGVTIALTAVATILVFLRLWARRLKGSRLGLDDYTIIVPLV